MTRQEYELIKKLSTETLEYLFAAIYDYDCQQSDCRRCGLSVDGTCITGHLVRDKEVDFL